MPQSTEHDFVITMLILRSTPGESTIADIFSRRISGSAEGMAKAVFIGVFNNSEEAEAGYELTETGTCVDLSVPGMTATELLPAEKKEEPFVLKAVQ
ncbi:MAG: hypothetical protein ACI9H6_000321 [Patiriisocius sp.]|jgi:hypothetical protein